MPPLTASLCPAQSCLSSRSDRGGDDDDLLLDGCTSNMNNAAELVELRKQGSITQEEFFVALNQLRRANTGSASAIAEASAEVVVVGGVDKDPVPGVNSSSSTASAVDTTRREAEEDEIIAEDCAADYGGGHAGRGEVSSVSGPAETPRPDTAARSPTAGPLPEAKHHISSITAQQIDTNSGRVDDVLVGATTTSPGVDRPPLSDGSNLIGDIHTEARCQREPRRSLLPEAEQQRQVPDTDVVGGDSQRQVDDEIDEKHDEREAAQQATSDDDSGWHISPSGEKAQQSTSNRRRSSIASPERQRQHVYRRTPESHGRDRSVGPTSAAAEGFNDYGTELVATFQTGSGADKHSRPGSVQLVEPSQHQSSSGGSTGGGRFCRLQPATPTRSFDVHGGCSKPRLAAGISPRKSDGDCTGDAIANTSTRSAPKPHWRPAGGELFQPHWQRCSSTTSRRQMSRPKPNTPSRSRPGKGDTCQGGDHADNGGRPAWGARVSPRGSNDGPTMALRTQRSPAKPPWRPAGEVDFQPRSEQSSRHCRSQPATPSGFSSQGTASDRTMATAWSDATASAGSGFVERIERRRRLGNTCPPDPGRAASQQQIRPEAHREGKASPPAAGATPGGYRAAATPFSSRRRQRPGNNTTAEEQDGTTTTPQAGQAPSISPTRVAHVGDRHELDDDDNGGVNGAGTGLPAGAASGLWRSRGRHREPRGAPPRRHSVNSNGSVGSFDSDHYFTTAVRCDRFGYPLHDRECLGSYGAGAGLSGGRGPRYSPMIKGLPDFYESRPKRQSRDDESLGRRTHGKNREAPAGRSKSLYQRTTEWQAKASEVRYEIG